MPPHNQHQKAKHRGRVRGDCCQHFRTAKQYGTVGQHRWLPHRGRKSAHARKRPRFGQHRFAIQIKLRAAARLMWREAARDHANGHGSNARETTEKRDGELFLKELQLTNEKQTGGLQPRARAKGGAHRLSYGLAHASRFRAARRPANSQSVTDRFLHPHTCIAECTFGNGLHSSGTERNRPGSLHINEIHATAPHFTLTTRK